MRETTLIRPSYSEGFRCIGPACEDSCCAGWRVEIDQATYEKYQTIPPGPLRVLIDASIVRAAETAESGNVAFAQIKMLPSMRCPFHNAQELCQIQAELGESYLSNTCAQYPRTVQVFDQLKDTVLSLSCPEACRLVLLNPNLLSNSGSANHRLRWDDTKSQPAMLPYFWPIREFVMSLITNRNYPLWQRIFLLGTFSRRLESVLRGEIQGGFPALLKGFSAAIDSGSLRASIESIPADLGLQLGMVLELLRLRANIPNRSSRFVESLNLFARGIGYKPEAPIESLTASYAAAYERYYAPFFLKSPFILENYLINMIFGRVFPFGKSIADRSIPMEPAREFALLATDFALIKGLLIGVAGGCKEEFSTDHVVTTIQTAFKHFEHNSNFLAKSHQILAEKKLDNAHGLTMLLRN